MKQILTIIFIFTSALCNAQNQTGELKLTRAEAIKTGLKNRYDIKAAQFAVKIAETEIKQTRNSWLPEINGQGSVKHSPQLQNSVIPGGVLPGFDEAALVPLTVKNEGVFGLSLNQPIFNSNLINDVKLSKNRLAIEHEKTREDEINITLQISQSYLNVQLRDLQMRIASDIAVRNSEYASIAEGMYKNGSLIENHYLRAQLDRDNAKQTYQQSAQDYALSLLQLRYQLNLPEATVIEISDSIDAPENVLEVWENKAGERTEVRQLKLQQQQDRLYLTRYQQSFMPSVSFSANYSQQFLSDRFNYGAGKWWSPYSYVALNINIPISAHFKNKPKVVEYQLRISQNELLLNQKQADINYEIQQARTSLSNALSNIKSTRSSYELSKTVFHNQQQQYRLGAFAYSELIDTEKSLSVTERNYIQSAYELMLAQIKLQKATNNF
ncbi:TolC family protein [Pedobacter antarcticus]|uniref:TolC family protein n=1 Tax=Pedobacter antarcticus TaxID=34086 RepID=UPI00292CDCF6|nr:TolC family protein [Pedobacter antarcticus]